MVNAVDLEVGGWKQGLEVDYKLCIRTVSYSCCSCLRLSDPCLVIKEWVANLRQLSGEGLEVMFSNNT